MHLGAVNHTHTHTHTHTKALPQANTYIHSLSHTHTWHSRFMTAEDEKRLRDQQVPRGLRVHVISLPIRLHRPPGFYLLPPTLSMKKN